jgi:hypothetical protein
MKITWADISTSETNENVHKVLIGDSERNRELLDTCVDGKTTTKYAIKELGFIVLTGFMLFRLGSKTGM